MNKLKSSDYNNAEYSNLLKRFKLTHPKLMDLKPEVKIETTYLYYDSENMEGYFFTNPNVKIYVWHLLFLTTDWFQKNLKK